MQYSLYIGRWQPWHAGHRWLIDQRLNAGKNVLIAIRDMPFDEKNPFTADEVQTNILKELAELVADGRIRVIIIPDIESVNYGRQVGYEIIEHVPPEDIAGISATKIREASLVNTNGSRVTTGPATGYTSETYSSGGIQPPNDQTKDTDTKNG